MSIPVIFTLLLSMEYFPRLLNMPQYSQPLVDVGQLSEFFIPPKKLVLLVCFTHHFTHNNYVSKQPITSLFSGIEFHNNLPIATLFHVYMSRKLFPPFALGQHGLSHAIKAFLEVLVFSVHKNLLHITSTVWIIFLERENIWDLDI